MGSACLLLRSIDGPRLTRNCFFFFSTMVNGWVDPVKEILQLTWNEIHSIRTQLYTYTIIYLHCAHTQCIYTVYIHHIHTPYAIHMHDIHTHHTHAHIMLTEYAYTIYIHNTYTKAKGLNIISIKLRWVKHIFCLLFVIWHMNYTLQEVCSAEFTTHVTQVIRKI